LGEAESPSSETTAVIRLLTWSFSIPRFPYFSLLIYLACTPCVCLNAPDKWDHAFIWYWFLFWNWIFVWMLPNYVNDTPYVFW
jgi:hypothetical protein